MSHLALKTFTNEALFEEVAHRLRRLAVEKTGKDIQFGEVAFVFHNGKFQMVEERSKNRIFRSDDVERRPHRRPV